VERTFDGDFDMTNSVRRSRTPHQLWKQSIDWITASGWPTREQDDEIARNVYEEWINATNREWLATGYRDHEILADALENAFRPIRDERAADSLIIIFLLLLEVRGRRDGTLQRRQNH